jgi:signal transduction histidine kinase
LQGYAAVAKLPRPKAGLVELERFAHQLSLLHPDIEVKAAATGSGWFDPAQLEQVVINLVKNAREAGSETSAIALEFELSPSGETVIEVLDRGPGFSDEALKSALLPLYTTKERGSGMGLALSREIVEAHNGSLALANRPDGGALVRVHLPGRTVSPSNVTRSRLTLGR